MLSIDHLTKRYGAITAVDDVSFSIAAGEIFGLIGPDGSGKTTIMRILCGLLSFEQGFCSIFDFDIEKEIGSVREIIGYMPQRFSLYPDLTVAENLRFFADLFQVGRTERQQRMTRLMAFSRLGPFQDRRAEDLSGGMKQKLALSCTLIHTPKLLILDEPTTGVDPVSRRDFWTILNELKNQGVTLLVSTAYMDEAGSCDRVAFLHQGRILSVDYPENIAGHFSHDLYEIEGENLYDIYVKLKSRPNVITSQLFGDKIHIALKKGADTGDLTTELAGRGSFEKIEPGIEDLFYELIREKG